MDNGASSHDAHHTACDRDPAPLAPIAPPSPIASTVRRQPPDTSHRRGKHSIGPHETRFESHVTTLPQHVRRSLATEGKSIQLRVRWCFDQRRSGTLVRFGGFLIFCRFPATSTDNAQAFQGDRQPDRPKTPRCPKLSATCVQIRAEARKTLIRGLVMGLSICVSHRYAARARPERVPFGLPRRGRPHLRAPPIRPGASSAVAEKNPDETRNESHLRVLGRDVATPCAPRPGQADARSLLPIARVRRVVRLAGGSG